MYATCPRALILFAAALFFRPLFSSRVHTSAVKIVLCNPNYFALQVLVGYLHSATFLFWQQTPLISLRNIIIFISTRQHAERAICYRLSVRLSIRLSVRHTGGSVENG